MKTNYPKTPELDKMKAVREKSQAIGEFLDIFLGEQRIHLCKFQEKGDNGERYYRWKPGTKVAKLDKRKVSERDPRREDAYNNDAEVNPEYESWSDRYMPINKPVERLLAEFFEIDLNKCEQERRAVLDYIRKEQPDHV